MGAHHAGPRALLAPMADASNVMRIDETDHAHAVLSGPLDADIHRLLGDDLAVAPAAIDHDHRAIVPGNLCMMVTKAGAGGGVLQIVGQHAHAVAVMAEQVGQHQMVGDQAGLFVGAAVGPADRHGKGMQPVGLDADFTHRTLPLGHLRAFPPIFALEGARFRVARALSTRAHKPRRIALFWPSPWAMTGGDMGAFRTCSRPPARRWPARRPTW